MRGHPLPGGTLAPAFLNIQLTEAIIELVRAGMGVAALAEWAVLPHLEKGALVSRCITKKGWHRTWNVVTWPKEDAGSLVMSFVERLAQEFAPRRKLQNPPA